MTTSTPYEDDELLEEIGSWIRERQAVDERMEDLDAQMGVTSRRMLAPMSRAVRQRLVHDLMASHAEGEHRDEEEFETIRDRRAPTELLPPDPPPRGSSPPPLLHVAAAAGLLLASGAALGVIAARGFAETSPPEACFELVEAQQRLDEMTVRTRESLELLLERTSESPTCELPPIRPLRDAR